MNVYSTVARLRRNDPNATFVPIHLWLEQDDVVLAEALERNDYVNEILFEARQPRPQQQQQRWDNLLRVVATREKLERVSFHGYGTEEMEQVAMILPVVQQNPFVQTVQLTRCDLSSGEIISSFLDTATSLTEFGLCDCIMTTQGAGRIAASLQRITNLRTLSLSDLEETRLTRILQGLEMNAFLQSLSLSLNYQTLGPAVSLAIQRLLERTPAIQSLELIRLLVTEESLGLICQALIRSTTTSKVRLDHCHFRTQASMDLFRRLLETKPNLQCAIIKNCSFPANAKRLVGDWLSAALLRPNSPLRTLELRQGDLNIFFPGPNFGALLSAVRRSQLERFNIGYIHLEEQFQTLLSNLPSMKIQELEIGFGWEMLGRDGGNRQQDLLRAVKRNFCLRSLKGNFPGGHPFFTDDDEKLLQFYFDRNKRLAQWVANPDTIPPLLWPDALGLALEAGENSLYRSLQAVLGDESEAAAVGQRSRERQVDNGDEK